MTSQIRPRIRATLKAVPRRVMIQMTTNPINDAVKMARNAALGARLMVY
jgi:hypothetical protein